MKRKFFFVFILCSTITFAFAQSPIGKGGQQLNFGLSGNPNYVPIYVSYDFGVHPDITVAPQVGIDLSFDWLNLGVRGDYHFNTLMGIPQDWDFYAGLSTGYSILIGSSNNNASSFFFNGQIGGRWYWSDKWGLNLEFGGGNLYGSGRIGVSMKVR